MTGWTYWLTWITSGMAEITAVAKYVEFWIPDLPNWITSLSCILILMAFNLTSTKMFGELFWFCNYKSSYNNCIDHCRYCNDSIW